MFPLFETFFDNLMKYGLEYFGKFYGVYRGTCTNNEDPEEQFRIKARIPAVTGKSEHGEWIWPIAKWSGRDSGDVCVPDKDDPVLFMFENGHRDHPMYIGGWWPKPNGDNFGSGMNAYSNGKPTKRIFKTKAGHEFSFEDDPTNLSCKLVWSDKTDEDNEKYSFLAFTKEGSLQMANHKGCFIEIRAEDGDERIMMMNNDPNSEDAGNMITLDKDGTKIVDFSGNVIDMKKDAIQIIGTKDVIINSQGVNVKTGGMSVGNIAVESSVKGTTFLTWFTTTFLMWLNAHTHPTGVGPSSAPLAPFQPAPTAKQLLSDKLKIE